MRPDDDTEVFTAPTVEQALRAARLSCGPQLQVLRAFRVVQGVRGLLGQARYSVVVRRPVQTSVTVLPHEPAAPAPGAPAADASWGADPVRSALDDLLDAAEERERREAAGEPTEPGWSWTAQQEVDGLLAGLGERAGVETARHPDPAVALHGLAADHLAYDDLDVLTVLPEMGTGWDRDELRRLGVPGPVLSRLPIEDPSDDAGWRRALLSAIASTVPPPAEPDEQHPVVVSGHGLIGAVAVLRSAVEDGTVPGTLTFDGRQRPATPAAIVDVLAACARS